MSNNQKQKDVIFDSVVASSITSAVAEKILGAIDEGLLVPGERIPSEPKLANQLGVSRNTVREVINSLVEKGILYKRRGIGTFITAQSPKLITANLASALGTSQIIKGQSKSPGQKRFTWREEVPSDDILEYLDLKPGDSVMHISRVRTANGISFSQSEEYMPLGIPKLNYDFSEAESQENWSLYEFFSEFGYEVNSVVTHVHAISANKNLSEDLGIPENEAILKLEQTHYSNNSSQPILHATNYHNEKVIDMMIVRAGLGRT